jgi:hypothetical protein
MSLESWRKAKSTRLIVKIVNRASPYVCTGSERRILGISQSDGLKFEHLDYSACITHTGIEVAVATWCQGSTISDFQRFVYRHLCEFCVRPTT